MSTCMCIVWEQICLCSYYSMTEAILVEVIVTCVSSVPELTGHQSNSIKRILCNTATFSYKHTLRQVTEFLAQRLRVSRDDLRLWKYGADVRPLANSSLYSIVHTSLLWETMALIGRLWFVWLWLGGCDWSALIGWLWFAGCDWAAVIGQLWCSRLYSQVETKLLEGDEKCIDVLGIKDGQSILMESTCIDSLISRIDVYTYTYT